MFDTQRDMAAKAAYIAIGAPVVVGRAVRDYGVKLAESTQTRLDEFATEGEKTAKKLQGGNVVEELQHRVDLEKVQGRVEKLRDQLEGALQSWRESFTPSQTERPAEKVAVETQEAAPVSEPSEEAATVDA